MFPRSGGSSSGREIRPWWHLAAGAIVWTAAILGLFVISVFVIPPIDGWSRADQLSLFQSATALAGFGAAGVAILLAATGPARPHGTSLVELIDVGYIFLERTHEATLRAAVPLEIRNNGDAIPLWWRVEITTSKDVDIDSCDMPGWILLPSRKRAVIDMERPLRPGVSALLGTVHLEYTAEALASLASPWNHQRSSATYLEGVDSAREFTVKVWTELGGGYWTYPVNVADDPFKLK